MFGVLKKAPVLNLEYNLQIVKFYPTLEGAKFCLEKSKLRFENEGAFLGFSKTYVDFFL